MLRVRGIGTKLAVAVAVTVGLAVAVLTVAVDRVAREYVTREADGDARRLVESIWRTTRSAMLDGRHERIRRTIGFVSNQGDIRTIQLLNHEGIVRYSSDRADEGRRVDQRAEGCRQCHGGGRHLTTPPPWTYAESFGGRRSLGVVRPINVRPECVSAGCHSDAPRVLGLLYVSVSMARNDASVAQLRNRFVLFAGAFTLLVTVMVFGLAGRLVSRPVTQLVEGTRRLASGELDHPIPVRGHDEISELARSFNENTEKLVRAQRKLLEMETLASIGRLAAGVAHEINNPLTGILTYAESMQAELQPEATRQHADLDAIIGETMRCREIVHRLLAFSRQRPVATHPTDLNALVERATQLLERQPALGKVALVRRLAPVLPEVPLDANQFHQVIINLVVNAAEAMPEGGVVTVETAAASDGSHVELHVTDTGPGVPPELRARLFEPFFTTKPKGTGLGLAVVWGIIQRHHARLSFTTELGKGTTFIIELPVAPDGPARPPAGGASAKA